MTIEGVSDEAAEVYQTALKRPLLPDAPITDVLGRAEIERHLPHRDPFLLVDRVTYLDRSVPVIACRYDLARARGVLAGHFPQRPMYPGVLHVEAIGQAAILLSLLCSGDEIRTVSMTHIRAARFVTVASGGELELVARVFEDGLFYTVVGQSLQGGVVCAAMIASGLLD